MDEQKLTGLDELDNLMREYTDEHNALVDRLLEIEDQQERMTMRTDTLVDAIRKESESVSNALNVIIRRINHIGVYTGAYELRDKKLIAVERKRGFLK